MAKRISVLITTKNVKGFTYSNIEDGDADKINVQIEVEVPESFEEASSPEFYGGETAAMDALQQDWARRSGNTARPVLREATEELDWLAVAQNAADSYKPGRRGGFKPLVSSEELEDIDDLEQLKALLRARGGVKPSPSTAAVS